MWTHIPQIKHDGISTAPNVVAIVWLRPAPVFVCLGVFLNFFFFYMKWFYEFGVEEVNRSAKRPDYNPVK